MRRPPHLLQGLLAVVRLAICDDEDHVGGCGPVSY